MTHPTVMQPYPQADGWYFDIIWPNEETETAGPFDSDEDAEFAMGRVDQ